MSGSLLLLLLLLIVAILALSVAIARPRGHRGGVFAIVYEWEHALAYVDGRFRAKLPPGRYFDLGIGRRRIFTLRNTEQLLPTPLVDVMSSDKLAFRIAATVTYRIDDPREAHENQYVAKLQLAVSSTLVQSAASRPLEAYLTERAALGAELVSLVGSPVCGCAIIGATITSVTLPPEVRRLFSEVERARMEGAAALERARGEHAALRSLANAARMLKGNPELMNLRVLQAMSVQGKGQSMLVLGQPAIVPIAPGVGEEAAAEG